MGKCTAVDTGVGCLRDMQGRCDLCGDDCYPNDEVCVVLTCIYSVCKEVSGNIFHQGCVEKYLRSIKFNPSRMTGFPCPRGRSKNSQFPECCKGKIDKTRHISARNEKKAKAAAARPPPQPPPQPRGPSQPHAKQAPPQPKPKKPPQPQNGAMPRKAAIGNRASAGPSAISVTIAEVAPEPEAKGPKQLVPGMELTAALTAAQRKNLRRRAKAKAPDNASEDGTASASGAASTAAGTGASLAGDARGPAGAGASASGSGSASGPPEGLLSSKAFVSDLDRYNALLGLYVGSDDEDAYGSGDKDEDGEGYEEEEEVEEEGQEEGEGQEGRGQTGNSWQIARSKDGSVAGADGAAPESHAAAAGAASAASGGWAAHGASEPAPGERLPAAAAVAAAPPASMLPSGISRTEAAERLVSRMFERPSFAEAAVGYLQPAQQARLAAAAEFAYPDLVAAIDRGDTQRFEREVSLALDLVAASQQASAAALAPASHYVTPPYVAVAAPPPAAAAPRTPAAAAAPPAGFASEGEDDDPMLDDLMMLCGVGA